MRPRILLMREAAQQMSSSGCCGRIEGEAAWWNDRECVFPERRAQMERAGAIYRSLRDRFGDAVELEVIDPRNYIVWVALAIADMWRFRRSLRELPRLLAQVKTSGVLLNGALLFNDLPEPEPVVTAVEQALKASIAERRQTA